jgi:hypothetical protein
MEYTHNRIKKYWQLKPWVQVDATSKRAYVDHVTVVQGGVPLALLHIDEFFTDDCAIYNRLNDGETVLVEVEFCLLKGPVNG